jgi:hypothetical protein
VGAFVARRRRLQAGGSIGARPNANRAEQFALEDQGPSAEEDPPISRNLGRDPRWQWWQYIKELAYNTRSRLFVVGSS